ncbi:CYTH domain-containing protein [Puniceicoccaceae bacterium K14]|nr:CYTH domain-containing protein [Puniceicoccaceae bacterium K14]
MNQEIERKFLITSPLPNISAAKKSNLAQGYIASGDSEVRIRKRDRTHTLTCKQGEGLVRQEIEIEISKDQFEALWPLTKGKRIEKTRYNLSHSNHTIEIDVYEGSLKPLVVAEVEFESTTESEVFECPSYFGLEVTEDSRYKNRNLAT